MRACILQTSGKSKTISGSTYGMINKKRTNGLQFPLGKEQIITTLGYIFTVVCFFIGSSIHLYYYEGLVLTAVNIVLSLVVSFSWFVVETINPEESHHKVQESYSCCSISIKKTSRYCSICCKRVFEMDHHCIFLNSCIGSRNYTPFLVLICFFMIQTLFQLICGALLLTIHQNLNTANRLVA